MMLYEKQIIDQVEVLKKTEVADAEGVLQRFSYIAKLQNALQQATEEIKNLKGDLQTANREVVNTRQMMEVKMINAIRVTSICILRRDSREIPIAWIVYNCPDKIKQFCYESSRLI